MAVTKNQPVTANIAAENTYSDWFGGVLFPGYFNVSISGTWSATVHLQRSFDGGTTVVDVASFTANEESVGFEPEANTLYRVGVKTGNYVSGTVVARISGATGHGV